MSRIMGIDLGTTNSVVAVYEKNGPMIVPNSLGERLTPSVVAFTKSGEILVGKKAKRAAVMNVGRTVFSIKRHMGTNYRVTIDGKQEVVPLREALRLAISKILMIERFSGGSPEPDASIFAHMSMKNSLVIMLRRRTAELLALPLCGLSSHHEPVLAEIISSSSALNKLIRAALRIPPARTASAM